MALFGLRFDFRNPPMAGVSMAERYAAALDMAAWTDRLGGYLVTFSEHHGSDDGYLPSPIPLAAAAAARTKNVRLAIVDIISQGRLDVVVTGGYVHSEFAMFDVALDERPRRMTECVTTLKQAWTGEPFEFRGRTVRVTPPPFTPGGPKVAMGGSSEAAARRAARLGDGFMPSEPRFWAHYQDECSKVGKPDPGPYLGGDTTQVVLAEDPEKAWAELGPYFLHETNAYGTWQAEAGNAGGFHPVLDIETLRAEQQYRILTPAAYTAELEEKGPFAFAMFHPMVGGIPPEAAWRSLELFEHQVLPHLD